MLQWFSLPRFAGLSQPDIISHRKTLLATYPVLIGIKLAGDITSFTVSTKSEASEASEAPAKWWDPVHARHHRGEVQEINDLYANCL